MTEFRISTTQTTTYSIDLDQEQVEDILASWFRRNTEMPEDAKIVFDFNTSYIRVTLLASVVK